MATGKGVLQSPSAENRWQLSESEQGWGQKPVLLEKTNCLGSETALGGSGQDEACAEMVLSVAPGKLRLGKLMPQKTWWEQGQSAFTEVRQLKKRLGGGQAQDAQWPCRPAWPPAADPRYPQGPNWQHPRLCVAQWSPQGAEKCLQQASQGSSRETGTSLCLSGR